MTTRVDPNRSHAAIPVDGTASTDRTAHTTADCRWCGRRIQRSHPHMGQDARWSHAPGTFTRWAAAAMKGATR